MKYEAKKISFLIILSLIAIYLSGCGRKSNSLTTDINPRNPMSDNFKNDFGNTAPFFNGGGRNPASVDPLDLGSAPTGGLSQPDKQGLNMVIDDMAKVNPMNPLDEFEVQDESRMREIIKREATATADQKAQLAAMKMQLAGSMLSRCASNVSQYAPRPGEPLIGKWSSPGCKNRKGRIKIKPFSFTVTATAAGGFSGNPANPSSQQGSNGAVQVDTKFNHGIGVPLGDVILNVRGLPEQTGNSIGMADPSGQGHISADTHRGQWKGDLIDLPHSGTGTLTYSYRTDDGTRTCTAEVNLELPGSQIPEKHIEGMKKAGQCFRKALVLMSPLMDRMFQSMDPKLAQILQLRLLGMREN